MNSINNLNGSQDSVSILIAAIIVLAAAWLVSDVLIILYFKRTVRFKTWFKVIKDFIKNITSNIYYGLLESRLVSVLGYSYDRKQDIFYSNVDCWQRKYGYCRLYDDSAVLSGMVCDCEPVYFDYNNKHWLIEFWKGQYELTTGCEIGVYNTERTETEIPGFYNGTFFDSARDEEMLHMSCKLYKNNILLFKRDALQWWLTGFKLGEFSNPADLKMIIDITLKDAQMLAAFLGGLKRTGYSDGEIGINGLTVSIVFGKPYSPQPYSRTKEIESMAQWKNKFMCNLYNSLTEKILNTPRKIYSVRIRNKEVFQHLKDMGRTKGHYDMYSKIEPYLFK